ncbi:MAG: sodium:solute symporter family protein [Candidatus Sericytochromatia bacterium]|nr:sodium:solute symporter family protein [Candidatus Sericytochromatia bacterium]
MTQNSAQISLAFIDWAVIILYFIIIIGIGLYLNKFTKSGEDYFLAGRKNSTWVAGLAFLSANLGALEILGLSGSTVQYGMYVAHFYWIGAIPAMIFLGLYMMPFYYGSNIHSIPGYLKLRFDEKTRILNGFAFALMTLLVSGINLYSMALVLRTFLGWDWNICMWSSAIAVGSYVTLGGLMSAIFTEIIQFFLIWFGLLLLPILGIVELGSVNKILGELPTTMSHLWSTAGNPQANAMGVTWIGLALGLGFVLSFGYWTTDFLVVQRAFSSKDLRSAQMAPIFASFFKMILPFIVVTAGLIAWKLDHQASDFLLRNANGTINYDSAVPMLIKRYYPSGLIGLGVTALLAGFMAGQAGNISAFNTVWTYDLYKSMIKKDATDEHLVKVGRITTVVGIILSIGTAYLAQSFPSIMDYMQAIFSWVNAPLFATMLLGMFWKRTSPNGAFWGLVIGMSTSITLFILLRFNMIDIPILGISPSFSDMSNNLWRAWWVWLLTFVLTIAISLVTDPKPESELVGLVKGLTPEEKNTDLPLLHKPGFWAVISIICCIALNIYFW